MTHLTARHSRKHQLIFFKAEKSDYEMELKL